MTWQQPPAFARQRRRHGRLRALTRDDRRRKAARNHRRGRDRPYVPGTRRRGAPVAPGLPPRDEVLERARAKHEGRISRRAPTWIGRLVDSVRSALRIGRRGGDR